MNGAQGFKDILQRTNNLEASPERNETTKTASSKRTCGFEIL